MDPKRMEQGIRTFLDGIGEGFPGDDQERTPERVARAWVEDLGTPRLEQDGYALYVLPPPGEAR